MNDLLRDVREELNRSQNPSCHCEQCERNRRIVKRIDERLETAGQISLPVLNTGSANDILTNVETLSVARESADAQSLAAKI